MYNFSYAIRIPYINTYRHTLFIIKEYKKLSMIYTLYTKQYIYIDKITMQRIAAW